MLELEWLNENDTSFPPLEKALKEPNGLLAAGGDLSIDRLICAYQTGIFPWYELGQPILWWSPDPRMVLYPDQLHISKSLNKTIKKQTFRVSSDNNFRSVIQNCATQRSKNRTDTWLTDEMQNAYMDLHERGYAHSVEVWDEQDQLVGGLYGVTIGAIFFGESMFSKKDNASKVALACLTKALKKEDFKLIDCQVESSHLSSLGAKNIKRQNFIQELEKAVKMSRNWPKITLSSTS